MASFKCPECRADVTKFKGDELGCPCCGYMAEKREAKGDEVTIPWQPIVIEPYRPSETNPYRWPPNTPYWLWQDPWYTSSDGTGTYKVGGDTMQVSFTCGQA